MTLFGKSSYSRSYLLFWFFSLIYIEFVIVFFFCFDLIPRTMERTREGDRIQVKSGPFPSRWKCCLKASPQVSGTSSSSTANGTRTCRRWPGHTSSAAHLTLATPGLRRSVPPEREPVAPRLPRAARPVPLVPSCGATTALFGRMRAFCPESCPGGAAFGDRHVSPFLRVFLDIDSI